MSYIPVHLNTLRAGKSIPFDVHLRLTEKKDHFVHYFTKVDGLDQDRVEKLKAKGVKKVYIVEADEEAYLGYLDQSLSDLQSNTISTTEKAALTKDTLNTQAENAERNLESEKGFNRMQGQMNKIAEFFTSEKGALQKILASTGIAADNNQHSANVASLALGIAALSGLNNPKDLLDLGVASLVHDIGLKKMGFPPNVTRETLSGDAQKRYLSHPGESVAILGGKPFITPRILSLIADHEEFGEGRGYPEKKRIEKLQPLSQILNLANAFDKYCIIQNKTPKEAIDPFFEKYSEFFVLDHLSVLAAVINAR